MKSKIEKLRGEIALQPEISFVLSAILEKQGEIIDYLNSQDKEEELTDKKKAIDKGVDRKDTPEKWEDRIRDLILDISADRLVSSEKVVAIVQSLLDDREREVLEDIMGETSKRIETCDYRERGNQIWEVINEKLKLNSKKK